MSTEGKTITCRAAILWAEGKAPTVETIEVQPPREGEARVRMVAAGVCATDAHFVWGWPTDLALDTEGMPMVLGHEGAGIVESVGPGVKGLAPGDKVVSLWLPECNACDLCRCPLTNSCRAGNFNTTLWYDNHTTRMSVNGKPLLAFAGTACFSEYAVVRASQLAVVSPKADLKISCVIGCAVGTGHGSATNLARVHKGGRCAVWGLGAIGLSCVMGCRDSGAEIVVGIDTNPNKEEMARRLGATHFINPADKDRPVEDELKALGIEYAFDCIGNQQVLDSAMRVLVPYGTLTVIGLGKRGNAVTAPVAQLLEGRTVTGGYFGNLKPREGVQRLVDESVAGRLDVSPLVTHRLPLADISTAFELLKAQKPIRVVIEF